MAVIAGYEASLYLMDTDQTPAALTLEPLEAVDTGRTVWRVAARAKRWLNPAVAVAVKVNGVITAPQAIVHAGGFVRFASGVAAGSSVTIDGQYFTAVNKLAGAKQWSLGLAPPSLLTVAWSKHLPSIVTRLPAATPSAKRANPPA